MFLFAELSCSAAAWQRLHPSRRPCDVHMSASPLPAEGQEIEVECLRIAYGGQGVARTESGATVMLSRAVPGERLRALVTRRRRRHVEARTTAVLAAGPSSVTPPWSALFASCGGCELQFMDYEAQLVIKRQWVIDAVARSPGGAAAILRGAAPEADATPATRAAAALEPLVSPTVASPRQTRYRNKVTFFFAAFDDGSGLAIGSKAADDAGRVVPIGAEGCPLQAVEADAVLRSLAAWAKQTTLHALDVHAAEAGRGGLWQAILRTVPGADGGAEVQLDLVTAGAPGSAALAALAALAAALLDAHPPLIRVLHTEAAAPPPAAAAGALQRQRLSPDATRGLRAAEPVTTVLAARGGGAGTRLTARVARPGGGATLRFEVAPRGFWQVNDLGTDALVQLVADGVAQGLALARETEPGAATENGLEPAAAGSAEPRLVDLFCGAGLFGVSLAAAGRFASVLGLELGPDAVAAASQNAEANGVGALCRFEVSDLAFASEPPAALAAALARRQGSELVVLVDPPRAGLSGAMRAALRRSSARVLLYVSCDAQTLGRDLADLCGAEGAAPPFRLVRATPVDLTPHAARVETVGLLWREGAPRTRTTRAPDARARAPAGRGRGRRRGRAR